MTNPMGSVAQLIPKKHYNSRMRNEFKVYKVLSKQLSDKQKNSIMHFIGAFHYKKVFFILTLGMTTKSRATWKFTEFKIKNMPNEKILLLKSVISKIEKKKFYPAPIRLRFLNGMSGQGYRALINSLVKQFSNAKYLEIGIWKGSTLCSAIYKNRIHAVAVDNYSEFAGPSKQALRMITRFRTKEQRLSLIDENFLNVNYRSLLPNGADIYLYDGPHLEEEHFQGALLAAEVISKTLIFIVDDWNWEPVRKGTLDGIVAGGLDIAFQAEIQTSGDTLFRYSRWHNGYAIFLLQKL
jgi:hypothetical protein